MATAEPDQPSPVETAVKLDSVLRSRKDASSKPPVVQDSHEKASVQRRLSADADCLSRSQKEEKLDHFLKHKKHRRRRRKKLTINDVRTEAAKILEEFLQDQLHQQEIQTSSPEKRYERYVEANITEETTPSPGSSGYLASRSGILREDSIPYADDSEQELMKAESLPHDDFIKKYFSKSDDKGLEIHHSKSKSAPYYGDEVESYGVPTKSIGHKRPPPAPPGTPHTPSEQGSTELVNSFEPVPFQGKPMDSSVPCSTDSVNTNSLERQFPKEKRPTPPKVPTTLDIPVPLNKSRSSSPFDLPMSSESRSSSSPGKSATLPAKGRKESGFATTDTDGEGSDSHEYLSGRRKKSVFKKAQERLHIFFMKSKDKPEREDSEKFDTRQKVKKKIKKPKKKKHIVDEADMLNRREDKDKVLEERHVHTKKHIHQTHIGEDRSMVYRTEDGTEVVDYDSVSGKKHIKKEWKVKESTDNDKGFIGKLRRLTSKTEKKRMKGSKSLHMDRASDRAPGYNRTVSVPYQHGHGDVGSTQEVYADDSDGFTVTGIERSRWDNSEEIRATQVVSRREDDIKRHSSHLDIVDHTGAMVERMFFDNEDKSLPRNMSFDYNLETCVHERRIKENGKVKVVRDVDTHDHISVTEEDVEMDGNSGDDQKPLKELTEAEKDELYGKIAERLAMIGDNLTVEREMEMAKSPATSPASKLSSATGGMEESPESEIKRTTLTQLETEIRDELRMVADEIDARLSADAKQAAIRIAGMATYNHFKNVVQESVGNEVGWAQVAAVFNITKRAVQLAGASGALAMQIKEMSLRYIEDKFANWIVAKGGWDSMLSDNSDSEGNYSDID